MTLDEFREATKEMPGDAKIKIADYDVILGWQWIDAKHVKTDESNNQIRIK